VHASVFAGGIFHSALTFWMVLLPGILINVMVVFIHWMKTLLLLHFFITV